MIYVYITLVFWIGWILGFNSAKREIKKIVKRDFKEARSRQSPPSPAQKVVKG